MGISVLKLPLRWLVVLAVVATWLVVPEAGSVSAAELPVGATLSVLADPVEVAGLGDGIFGAASSGQTLRAGDTIRTGSSGIAVLTFFDGSETQLGSSSQLQIEQADYGNAPQIALFQTQGSSVNRVIPLPPGGSFRTDTPDAAGLVRGTSYVVNVGAAGSTLVLLTDRDGHVGHVQVVPAQADSVVDLVRAGDVGSASHATSQRPQTTAASHLDDVTLATLEHDAQDLHDADGAQAVPGALVAVPATASTPAAAVVVAATDDQQGSVAATQEQEGASHATGSSATNDSSGGNTSGSSSASGSNASSGGSTAVASSGDSGSGSGSSSSSSGSSRTASTSTGGSTSGSSGSSGGSSTVSTSTGSGSSGTSRASTSSRGSSTSTSSGGSSTSPSGAGTSHPSSSTTQSSGSSHPVTTVSGSRDENS